MPFRIEFSPDAEEHLRVLTKRQQTTVLDEIESKLTHQPEKETKNRKPMRPNPAAPWELRVGDLRVYYDVEYEPEPVVKIRAVGRKARREVRIGKEVVPL